MSRTPAAPATPRDATAATGGGPARATGAGPARATGGGPARATGGGPGPLTAATPPAPGATPPLRTPADPPRTLPAGPVWFGLAGRPMFGWVHQPTGPAVPGPAVPPGAVVLCPPLLGELPAIHPTYQALARDLAAAGHWVVRFDYEGTGDSAGPADGPGRVGAWLDGVDRAVALARSCTGGPVALAGMRMGALLAAVAAGRRSDVDALVLWDPCRSGRAFLRQLQALHALRFPPTGDDGTVETPGYALGAAMAREVGELRLPGSLRARRALVLSRPGGQQPEVRLGPWDGDEPHGSPTLRSTVPGEQEALLDVDHLRRQLPARGTATVVAWLDAALRSRPAGPRPPAGPPPWWVPAGDGVALPVEEPVGATVRERAVRLGPSGLFGIETERAGAGDGARPTVVLLSSGTDTHVGPSRLWVQLARRWAASGHARCVRVDLSGWGESDPRPGRPARVLRAPEAFDDVAEVVAGVGDPRRVVLVGLCSGAYQALESALELRPAGVLAINPLLRFTPPELLEHGAVAPRRRICEAKRPWVDAARARLPGQVVEVMTTLRVAASRIRSTDRSTGWLDELVRSDVRLYCICGEEDALPFTETGERARASWWSSGHVRIDVVPGLDHALVPAVQRESACDRLTEELHRIGLAMRRGDAATAPVAAGAGGSAAAGPA